MEQLIAQGELEQMRNLHAYYALNEAEAAEGGLHGPQQAVWLVRLRADYENCRAALEWSLQCARNDANVRFPSFSAPKPSIESRTVVGSRTLSSTGDTRTGMLALELCLRLAAALRTFWEWQGNLTEARYWLETVLKIPIEDVIEETALAARAKALSEYSRLECLQKELVHAVDLAEESITLFRHLNDSVGLAHALLQRTWIALAMNEYEGATQACQEGLEQVSQTDNVWLRAQLLFSLGTVAGFTDDFERMHALYTQSKELLAQVGDTSAIADVLKDQGGMLILEGKTTEGIDCLLKSLQFSYQLDCKQYMTTALVLLSLAVGLRGEPDPMTASIHSAQLTGVVDNLMETVGLPPWTTSNPFVQIVHQHVRSHVDTQSWESAWKAGRNLTLEQAIDLASRMINPSSLPAQGENPNTPNATKSDS